MEFISVKPVEFKNNFILHMAGICSGKLVYVTLLSTTIHFNYPGLSSAATTKGHVIMGKAYAGHNAVLCEKPETVFQFRHQSFRILFWGGFFACLFFLLFYFPTGFSLLIQFALSSVSPGCQYTSFSAVS